MSSNQILKRTALFEEHKKLGGKIVPFAGWEMPVQYSNIIEEHLNVRNKAGLFDVSHMGQVFISGKDALDYLQKLVPQDISKLQQEKAVYTQFTNSKGGIIDDLIIYSLSSAPPLFLLIINASRIDEDVKWLLSNKNNFDVVVDNQSDNFSMIALQGPLAADILDEIALVKESHPKRFCIKETKLLDEDVFIAATGYTGEDGFEIIIKNEKVVKLWKEILNKGQKFGLKPIGLAARDTLRLEAGLCLYGQDMNETTTPVEASLTWTISKDKKENYFGKDKIFSQINKKDEAKKLVGFKMLDKSIPRHDYRIYINNEEAGVVTSGGVAPSLGQNIGFAYINSCNSTDIGTKINIKIREKLHPAEIVKRPFYNRMSL